MAGPSDDLALVDLSRSGDEQAALQLFQDYADRLLALARRRMSLSLASRVDPEDIVQSVFRTFFQRLKNGQFTLEEPDDLCKLLMRITVHKTLRQVAYHQAAKRDLRQEAGRDHSVHEEMLAVLDREPSADVAIAFLEQLDYFLNRLKPLERQILEMRMQGDSNEEIARKLGLYDRKVRRVVEQLRRRAQEMEIEV